MALVPRVQFSGLLRLSLRSWTASARPAVPALASRWRCLSVASCPAWNAGCRAEHRSLFKWTVRPLPVVVSRGYATEGLTVDELKERTVNVLKLFDKVNPDKVTLEAHFMNDLGMDSLDTVEVVMAFEDEFGVEISDEEAEKIFSCSDAVELLKTKLDLH